MDVYLKVLKGAKSGGTIAIKKEKFLIGRSRECNLCASTNSISRQHCLIMRKDASVTIQDLDSRNGTLVNGHRIEQEVELHSGDELVVGPLRFMLTISHGISNLKRSKTKSVAEVVERTAHPHREHVQEEHISSWLGGSEPIQAMNETLAIKLDDTNATEMRQAISEATKQNAETETVVEDAEKAKNKQPPATAAADESTTTIQTPENKDTKKHKGPGKLPRRPSKPTTKDSREAAAAALRSWGRHH